jgi:hypothetical protein
VIEVLPPTDPLQGAESVEIEIKRNGMPYMPPSEPIRTHRMLSFTLKRRGHYRISGVNGLARPLTLRVNPSDLNMPSDPEPLTIQLTTSTQQYKYAAYGEVSQASKEQVIEIEHFGVGDVPVCAVHCPVPVTVTWTCGDEYKQQRSQINDASKIDNHVNSLLVFAWKRREALSFVMDAGSFGRLSLSIRPRALPQQQEPSSQTLPTSQRSPYLLQRIQWLSEEAMKMQGDEVVMVPVPLIVQARLKKLKSVPEYAHLVTMTQFPQGLLPHLCALTKMLQYEEDKLFAQ